MMKKTIGRGMNQKLGHRAVKLLIHLPKIKNHAIKSWRKKISKTVRVTDKFMKTQGTIYGEKLEIKHALS